MADAPPLTPRRTSPARQPIKMCSTHARQYASHVQSPSNTQRTAGPHRTINNYCFVQSTGANIMRKHHNARSARHFPRAALRFSRGGGAIAFGGRRHHTIAVYYYNKHACRIAAPTSFTPFLAGALSLYLCLCWSHIERTDCRFRWHNHFEPRVFVCVIGLVNCSICWKNTFFF